MQTLYKYSTKGAPLQWSIEVEGDKYRTIEGQVGGKLTTSQWTICFAKNVGKANATTAEEQALKKAESIYRKKKDAGFSETLESSGANFFEPMLAHKWDQHPLAPGTPLALQPKLDGHRCIAYLKDGKVYLQSRKGKQITSCTHIENALEDLFKENQSFILDGELYNHTIPFEKISGLVRQIEHTAECKDIQYHVYDLVDLNNRQLTFDERNWQLVTKQLRLCNNEHINMVTTLFVNGSDAIAEYESECVEDGYEGIMIRDTTSIYENKRSKGLLKLKQFQDEEFNIVEIKEGQGNRTGLATEAVLALEDGRAFSTGVIGNEEYARGLFNDREKVKGMLATVKYQGKTAQGIPRFGKMKIVRYEGF